MVSPGSVNSKWLIKGGTLQCWKVEYKKAHPRNASLYWMVNPLHSRRNCCRNFRPSRCFFLCLWPVERTRLPRLLTPARSKTTASYFQFVVLVKSCPCKDWGWLLWKPARSIVSGKRLWRWLMRMWNKLSMPRVYPLKSLLRFLWMPRVRAALELQSLHKKENGTSWICWSILKRHPCCWGLIKRSVLQPVP